MKKLLLITITLFLLINICLSKPWEGFEDFELDENGFPKGWVFGKCGNGCKVTNIGNGRDNTNTVYIKD